MRTPLFILLSLLATALSAQTSFKFTNVTRLSPMVNTAFEESTPIFDPAHNVLYFTRSLYPGNKGGETSGQDIWYTTLQNGLWSTPSNDLGKLNNVLNNAPIGVSTDGTTLYLLGTYQKKISLQQGFSYAVDEGHSWSAPRELDIPGLVFHADFYGGMMNQTGDVFLISMDSKDSEGQEDLYICIREDGKWTRPIWLGDSINSEGYEISPVLCNDNQTLIFASSGHGGLGDCDIFYAHRKDSSWTNWTKPVNMGAPINSAGFDGFAFPVNELVYFASNRESDYSDLYSAVNTAYFRPADTLRLAFEVADLRVSEMRVDVFDDESHFIGSYVTGEDQIVRIPGLHESVSYSILPRHSLIDPQLAQSYVVNADGAPVKALHINENGSTTVTALSAKATQAMPVIERASWAKGMSGIFELQHVPLRNMILVLEDEEGHHIKYTRTDDNGRFSFPETDDSANLHIRVMTDLEYVKTNGVIYFTDQQGNKLFKATSTGEGRYAYQKLEAQQIAQLKMLKEMDDVPLQEAKGVFKFQNLPKEGVKLYLVDENDNIIEEVVTDETGQFQFKKIRPDQAFKIKVAEAEDTELSSEGVLFFLTDEGDEINLLNKTKDGKSFSYKPIDPDLKRSLMLMQEEEDAPLSAESFVFSVGLFKYKNLPREGITLRLLDENDKVIETVTTDENGKFVFSMLRPDQNYRVEVVSDEIEQLDSTELYFVGSDGKVITAKQEDDTHYTFQEFTPDYFFSVSQVNNGETQLTITESFKDVKGAFNYQGVPRKGVTLYLLDENDKIIETVQTDENGNFIFSKLARESNYFVRVAEEDATLLDESSFVVKGEEDEDLVQSVDENGNFRFVTLPRKKDQISSLEESSDRGLDAQKFLEEPEPTMPIIPASDKPKAESTAAQSGAEMAIDKNSLRLSATYFLFNSVRLSDRDRYHLNQEVISRVRNSGQPLLIVGYSCDIGTAAECQEVAQLRAEEVKAYLVSMGIDAALIEVATESDGLSGIENPTAEQRIEHRKVEIYHLVL